MNLYLDCEFNGFGGELISMGLVDEKGRYFYEVLNCLQPVEWVAKNVIPKLNQEAVPLAEFQKRLRQFLNSYESIHIIADWAEDLSLFTRSLIIGAGRAMHTPSLTLELWTGAMQIDSEIPHNALADAKALAYSYNFQTDQH